MRAYILGFLISFLAALLIGTGWYTLFGYDHYQTTLENLIEIYYSYSFWAGVGIWTVLYYSLCFPNRLSKE
jgi:hypothetical protein